MTDFNTAFRQTFERAKQAPAIFTQDGQTIDFARLSLIIDQLTSRLVAEGVAPGHRVICLVDNWTIRICFWFALFRIGAVQLMGLSLSQHLRCGQIPDFAIVPPGVPEPRCKTLRFDQSWVEGTPPSVTDQHGGAMIYLTNHTTRDLVAVKRSAPHVWQITQDYLQVLGPAKGPVFMSTSIDSIRSVRDVLRAFLGKQPVIEPRANPKATYGALCTFKASELFLSPLALHHICEAAEASAQPYRFDRIFVGGGTPRAALLPRALNYLSPTIDLGAGTVEAGVYACHRYSADCTDLRNLGPAPTGVEAAIFDAAGRMVPPECPNEASGELGLRIAEASRVEGYLNAGPAYTLDGWSLTGFHARIDAQGNIWKLGRLDDRINLGGTRFFAGQLEAELGKLREISKLAVLKTYDEQGAEALGVLVAPATRLQSEFDPEALRHGLADILKMAAGIIVRQVDDVPLDPNGQIDRVASKALFENVATS